MAEGRSSRRQRGPVELATSRDLTARPDETRKSALAAQALDLARRLDEAPTGTTAGGLAAAALGRELRMTLELIEKLAPRPAARDGVDELASARAERRRA